MKAVDQFIRDRLTEDRWFAERQAQQDELAREAGAWKYGRRTRPTRQQIRKEMNQ